MCITHSIQTRAINASLINQIRHLAQVEELVAQVEELMEVNPGLKSRFSEKLHFPDFSPEDGCNLMEKRMNDEGWTLHEPAAADLPQLMAKVCDVVC